MKLTFNEDTHQYFTDDGVEIPSVTTILNYVTAGHYSGINPSVLERAKAKGTAVHEACEILDYGCELEEVESDIVPHIIAYQTFLRDYRPKWDGIEQIVADRDYCGTVDRFGTIGRKNVVVDIKTTSSPTKRNYVSVCCQTMAYALAIDHTKNFDRYGLFLKSNGDYRLFNCKEFEEKQGFDSAGLFFKCLDLYKTLKTIEERKNGK